MDKESEMRHKTNIVSLAAQTMDVQHDNEGQIVIYTGIYDWEDGSFHDEPEPITDDEVL